MSVRWGAALVALSFASGCATTQYPARVVARGELTLRYDGGFEMWAEGREVSSGLSWSGLADYVACVPEAHEQARKASGNGVAAIVLSTLGGSFGLLGLGGAVVGMGVDPDHATSYILGGAAVAATGLVLAIVGRAYRNSANGHAVDAMNYYNDRQGVYGGTCHDPAAPPPPPPLPPSPPPGEYAPPAASPGSE